MSITYLLCILGETGFTVMLTLMGLMTSCSQSHRSHQECITKMKSLIHNICLQVVGYCTGDFTSGIVAFPYNGDSPWMKALTNANNVLANRPVKLYPEIKLDQTSGVCSGTWVSNGQYEYRAVTTATSKSNAIADCTASLASLFIVTSDDEAAFAAIAAE
jgi:hypothetical protein